MCCTLCWLDSHCPLEKGYGFFMVGAVKYHWLANLVLIGSMGLQLTGDFAPSLIGSRCFVPLPPWVGQAEWEARGDCVRLLNISLWHLQLPLLFCIVLLLVVWEILNFLLA